MVRIKICGITTPADALLAAELGADAIGLNFYPGSPRSISEARAREILAALPPFVEPVGLFVNERFAHIHAVAGRLGLRTLQLHGEALEPLPQDGYRYVVAFRVRDESSLEQMTAYVVAQKPAAVLVDAHVSGSYGGTGQQAPWHLLEDYQTEVPLILAGGLTSDNVGEAVRRVHPCAVDVASGVESEPGVKDQDKMRRFIDAARLAATR
jgi:phosphoribosylanthranilate isomerase